ncbi:tyrosyl-DNA phosphodiesterase I [Zopfochytrium polystomum]|nr:tyrosyl-DNA phosphodiesterase I [Zopfochytrium polystomum]
MSNKRRIEVVDLTASCDEDETATSVDRPPKRGSTDQDAATVLLPSQTPTSTQIPSGIRLTRIAPLDAIDDATGNAETVDLSELINEPWRLMYQFNYKFDPEWFFGHLDDAMLGREIVFVVHYQPELKAWSQSKDCPANIKLVFPRVEMFGTHHTKMMIFFYEDDTARVVIHTANLVQTDWGKKTQGAWISTRLRKLEPNRAPGRNPSFGPDLLAYLSAYGRELEPLRALLATYDMTHETGAIVGSVPGRHRRDAGALNSFGHLRLGHLLATRVPPLAAGSGSESLVLQFSSVGGGLSEKWMMQEFRGSLLKCKKDRSSDARALQQVGTCVVYPTVEEVRDSNQGWRGGGSIPFNDKTWVKQQSWFRRLLHRWEATKAGRSGAMPHIKTFSRVSATGEVAWFLLTSHNLSQAAWGSLEKSDSQLFIRSYELGVLIYPELFQSQPQQLSTMRYATANDVAHLPKALYLNWPLSKETAAPGQQLEVEDRVDVLIRFPFDFPLSRYRAADDPWRWDVLFEGFDTFGMTRESALG